ncbi:MAG: hypothetical protein DCC55_39565, partial [Chloroflexi bacterium]
MCYNPGPMEGHFTAVSPSALRHGNGNQATNDPAQATFVAPGPGEQSSVGVDLGIVILSYNTIGLLHDCLRSVLACQGDFRYQVCVVDNASGDGSVEMVQTKYPGVQVLVLRTNLGYSAGNNVGLRWFGFS